MASRTTALFPSFLLRRQAHLPSTARLRALTPAAAPSPLAPIRSSLSSRTSIRFAHSIPRPPPITPREPDRPAQEGLDSGIDDTHSTQQHTSESPRPSIPSKPAYYQLSFTCVPCGHRSHHNVSKQGYHKGSTLITCPECRNRHVISDHLGIFGDRKLTVEDLMREKGQLVKRGSLGEDGDIEFWPDEGLTDGPVASSGETEKTS